MFNTQNLLLNKNKLWNPSVEEAEQSYVIGMVFFLKIPPCLLRRKGCIFKLTDKHCKIKIRVYSIWCPQPDMRNSIDV